MKRPSYRRSAGVSLADLLVVAALIPLLSVAMLGCYRSHHRGESSGRMKCAANLKSIGLAMLQYAQENRGAFPRTTFKPGPRVIPTWGTGSDAPNPFGPNGPEANDVSAAFFLLMRTQDITLDSFVCPQSTTERWDLGGGLKSVMDYSNWPGRDGVAKYLSYSMQNPYPDDEAVKRGFKWGTSMGAEVAIAADINPGTKGKNQNVLSVNDPSGNTSSKKQANSVNHNQEGQNVLYADGHVDFAQNPFAGPNLDNIYARRAGPEGTKSSEVENSSFDGSDNVLLPTDD